ncbi:tyrosine-protein kinase domain-containing protein [Actinomycetospora sp. C-140]
MVAVLSAVGLLVGVLAGLTSVRTYSAHTNVYVAAQPTADSSTAYQGALLAEQKARIYAQLATGWRFTSDTASAARVDPTVVTRQVAVAPQPDSSLIVVSASDVSPVRAASLADAGGAAMVRMVGVLEQTDPGLQPAVTAAVVEPATIPTAPVSLGPPMYVVLGLLLGVLLGLGLAVLRETLDNTVRTASRLNELLGAPCLGVVGDGRADTSASAGSDGNPSVTQVYREIRTNLQFEARSAGVFVMTSCSQADGATTVSRNLAVVLGQQGHSVVVVDADLRSPQAAERPDVSNATGLTDVLVEGLPVESALQRGGAASVSVLARGLAADTSGELICSEAMVALLEKLSGSFDFVFVEAPPIESAPDATILATLCRGVILVTRAGVTTPDQLRGARTALSRASARIVGAVLLPETSRSGHLKRLIDRGRELIEQRRTAEAIPATSSQAHG